MVCSTLALDWGLVWRCEEYVEVRSSLARDAVRLLLGLDCTDVLSIARRYSGK